MELRTEKFEEKIKNCMQNEPSFCTAVCPFHLDIKDFMPKMQRGGFNAAYRTYLNAVGFPGIVSELCDEPCKNVCPRRSTDQSISMKLLEKASINFARNLNPNSYNMPSKNKKIAIIGAGISGLGCALRLASKKYDITVFEKSNRIGGHLWDLMLPEIFLADIERQFMYEKYTLCLNMEIKNLDDLNFDVIYVATGKGGLNFGLKRDLSGAFASNRPGVFLGGELCGSNIIEALADGLNVINAIERYIKAGSMNQPEEKRETKIKLNTNFITRMDLVLPSEGGNFNRDEAINEAKRCLKCSCDACIRHCDLMKYYSKYPKRIGEEVEITITPGTLDGNGTVATRLISTCNQCGLCKEVCPIGIDTGEFLLQSHHVMHEKGAMPWAFHDFWLRDMEFTNGEAAGLCKLAKGYDKSKYMFFPGCQLGASDTRYVTKSYDFLLAHNPDTSLMLGCCGAPADWAGNEPIHSETMKKIRDNWIILGKPTAIFACPTCKKMFQKYLPEIKGVFLYDLMLEWGISPSNYYGEKIVSVFDPCASRDEPELQESIRKLAKKAGFKLEPLPYEGKLAKCCSWGGHVSTANPPFAREVIKARISENTNPYIVYCINCRDIFASANKPVYHILETLFSINGLERKPPTITERRNNRVALKLEVLKEFWKGEVNMEQRESKIQLYIAPELREKLSGDMILEMEIEKVIEYCENSGRKVINSDNGHFIGHLKIENMTFWAEYASVDTGFELYNAYGHRMEIEEA